MRTKIICLWHDRDCRSHCYCKLHTARARSVPLYTMYRNVYRSVLALLTSMVWYIQNERIKFLIIHVPYFWSINDLFWGLSRINFSFPFLDFFSRANRTLPYEYPKSLGFSSCAFFSNFSSILAFQCFRKFGTSFMGIQNCCWPLLILLVNWLVNWLFHNHAAYSSAIGFHQKIEFTVPFERRENLTFRLCWIASFSNTSCLVREQKMQGKREKEGKRELIEMHKQYVILDNADRITELYDWLGYGRITCAIDWSWLPFVTNIKIIGAPPHYPNVLCNTTSVRLCANDDRSIVLSEI